MTHRCELSWARRRGRRESRLPGDVPPISLRDCRCMPGWCGHTHRPPQSASKTTTTCVTSFVETQAGGLGMAARGSAVRRRERRVRSWWRHEQASVRMALVTGTILVPLTEYVAPAPAVVSDVPATVIEYMFSAPVTG